MVHLLWCVMFVVFPNISQFHSGVRVASVGLPITHLCCSCGIQQRWHIDLAAFYFPLTQRVHLPFCDIVCGPVSKKRENRGRTLKKPLLKVCFLCDIFSQSSSSHLCALWGWTVRRHNCTMAELETRGHEPDWLVLELPVVRIYLFVIKTEFVDGQTGWRENKEEINVRGMAAKTKNTGQRTKYQHTTIRHKNTMCCQ